MYRNSENLAVEKFETQDMVELLCNHSTRKTQLEEAQPKLEPSVDCIVNLRPARAK